jgi:hypothetical protein
MPCYGKPPAPAPAPAPRRSRRLAAKPRIDYYEAPVPSEAQVRAQAEADFVRNALKAKRNAERAVAREDKRKAAAVERIMRQLERPAVTPKRTIALSAPPPAPKLERRNAVLDLHDGGLPPPPPLRRTCQLPTCDEWCSYCRENDRIAALNRLPPPPTHLPVLRVPINLGAMTAQEMSDLIAALAQAMVNK